MRFLSLFLVLASSLHAGTPVALSDTATAAANATTLQTAIDGGPAELDLPAGTFALNRVYLTGGTTLRGAGAGVTVLVFAPQTIHNEANFGGLLNVNGTSGTPIENVVIADLTIDGNRTAHTISGTTNVLNVEGLDFKYARRCQVENVEVLGAVSDGFDFDFSTFVELSGCYADDCGGYGFHCSMQSLRIRFIECTAAACGFVHSRGGFDQYQGPSGNAGGCDYIECTAIDCYRNFYVRAAGAVVVSPVSVSGANADVFTGAVVIP